MAGEAVRKHINSSIYIGTYAASQLRYAFAGAGHESASHPGIAGAQQQSDSLISFGIKAQSQEDNPNAPRITIDPVSVTPLYVETEKLFGNQSRPTGTATGFIYEFEETKYFITNWHVVTGRRPSDSSEIKVKVISEKSLIDSISVADPDLIKIHFHAQDLGDWYPYTIPLYHNGKAVWMEHPEGRSVDVVAIKLDEAIFEDSMRVSYPITQASYSDDLYLFPTMNVAIIGFPFGFTTVGKYPIYKTGQISYDYDLNIGGLPKFYIDASTRGGMSGSPVIAINTQGGLLNNGVMEMGGRQQRFLGVYSGRLPYDSDIGFFWKEEAIISIIQKE